MNEIKLSKRLYTIANFIREDTEMFADIGTDHAYLPCYICLNNSNIRAIASDVAKGPYESALRQVEKLNLQHRIDVRLGNGLQTLKEDEVDCIVIAGMGGSLITSILESSLDKLNRVKRLILQPNVDSLSIRKFAINHQYEIVNEHILSEEGHIYEIIVLEKAKDKYDLTEKQLFFGPYLLNRKNDAFTEKWQDELIKKQQIVEQMKRAKEPKLLKITQFEKEIKWIKEELN